MRSHISNSSSIEISSAFNISRFRLNTETNAVSIKSDQSQRKDWSHLVHIFQRIHWGTSKVARAITAFMCIRVPSVVNDNCALRYLRFTVDLFP